MRTVRSFVRREGRMSQGQKETFEALLPQYELVISETPWCFEYIFARSAPTIVEIGFGSGDALLAMAQQRPDLNFIGVEVYRTGMAKLVASLKEASLSNVRVVCEDAVTVFKKAIATEALAGIHIFFPDPWPKKRHHKRRLIQKEFLASILKGLKEGGYIHCATDWENYAQHMLSVFSTNEKLINADPDNGFLKTSTARPLTKYERRGLAHGHQVFDLMYFLATKSKYPF